MILDKKLNIILIVLFYVISVVSDYQKYNDALFEEQSSYNRMQTICDYYGLESDVCEMQKINFNMAVKAKEKAQWWKW
jgi:hypothetical protein